MAKKTIIHALGAISYALAQWLIITFAVRFISLDVAGLYAFYLAIFTPASILLAFGLRNSIASDSSGAYAGSDYARARTIGMCGLAAVFGMTLLAGSSNALVASSVFFMKLFEMYVEPIYGDWVRCNQGHRFGVSKILRLFIFILLFFGSYGIFGADELLLFCYPAASLLVIVFYDRNNSTVRAGLGLSDTSSVGLLIRFSLPLAVGSFFISLATSLPRVGVGLVLDDASVGMYVLLTYFVSLSAIPLQSISQINIPRFSKYDDISSLVMSPLFRGVLWATVCAGLFFALFMAFFGRYAIDFFYGVGDGYGFLDFVLIGIAGSIQYLIIFLSGVFVSRRVFAAMSHASYGGLFSVVLTLVPLLNFFGLTGAYISYLIALIVMLVVLVASLVRLKSVSS